MISVITPSIRPAGLQMVMDSLESQTTQDYEWLVEMGTPWRGCDLSAAMNRMLYRAKGDIIVIVQDYMMIPPDALERIIENHRLADETLFTYPVSKIQEVGGAEEHDWRINKAEFVPYYQWETDFASAPTDALLSVNGYDEDFDEGWSWENVNIAHRISKKGYAFRCDKEIPAIALDHDAFMEHPFRGIKENGELSKRKSMEIERDDVL